MVPASFHPAEKSAPVHPAATQRHRATHANPLRQASLTQKHAPRNPVIMARLAEFETTNQPALMMVIFRSTDSRAAGSPQLRTVNAGPAVTNVRKLQSSENPALQIHLVQMVDPETGTPMQILEIVFVMPQQPGSPSQSI
jgi:hypothetical protein